jgi:4-amino-4-deoxychorismate lyase
MCLLFESIKLQDGILMHLGYHQSRVDRSRNLLLQAREELDLSGIAIPGLSRGVFKCRITYKYEIENIEITPYTRKPIQNLKLVVADDLEYPFKYEDRSSLTLIKERYPGYDEIIIVKNGLITDTSYSNLVFYDGLHWATPSSPLLNGTCRHRLLNEGKIIERTISPGDLKRYSSVSLINAMTGLGETVVPVSSVQ